MLARDGVNYLDEVRLLRQRTFELPEHTALIECSNGTRCYIIGTAHFSEKSNEDVRFLMNNLRPDILVLELCNARQSVLMQNLDMSRNQMDRELNLMQYVKEFGPSRGVLQYFLFKLSHNVTEQLGMVPGGEFISAFEEAQSQQHCHVILGDRPIGITLNRTFQPLGIWAKMSLFWTLISSFQPITKEEVEKLKNADLIDELMKEICETHPQLAQSILHERDRYLCRSIWEACGMNFYELNQKIPIHCCSRWPPTTKDFPRVVMAVVGLGHVNGIKKYWDTAGEIDKKELSELVEPTVSWRLFSVTTKILVFTALIGTGFCIGKGASKVTRFFFSRLKC